MKELTLEEFYTAINSPILVLIEFWSRQCIYCEKAEEYLIELEQAYKVRIIIAKVNVEMIFQLASMYSISRLPTFILFKNSIEVTRIIGYKNKNDIERLIRLYI